MNVPNNGGSAFPMPHFTDRGENTHWGEGGMTLRDYFAAAALQGILMNYTTEKFGANEETVARYAYRYADAMLAERAEGGAK